MRSTLFVVGIILIVAGILIVLTPGTIVAPVYFYGDSSKLLHLSAVLVTVGGALSVVAAKFLRQD